MMRLTSTIFCAIKLGLVLHSYGAAAHSGGHTHMEMAIEAERVHRFELAEHHLQAIIVDDPRNLSAWLKLASLETVRGDLQRARDACATAARLSEPLVALACRGRIALAGGADINASLQTLNQTLQHPSVRERTDPIAQWGWGVAAELAVVAGDHVLADHLFQRALAYHAPVHLQAAYLDHLLATNRAHEVLEYVAVDDQELARQLRRVLAMNVLGLEDETNAAVSLDTKFKRWIDAGDFTHGREMAMFYLHVYPDREIAQLAAENNLRFQREKEDLLLCREAYALGEQQHGNVSRC